MENTAKTAVFHHVPIMVDEVTELLRPQRGGLFVDGTLGGGGHSEAILKLLPEDGRLIGIDRDETALRAATARLAPFSDRFTAIHGNFFHMKSLLLGRGVTKADGILLDLGVSSYQLDEPSRGFSYKAEAPLDMRMDQSASITAADVVNGYPEKELTRIFRDYGEERFSPLIARRIVEKRALKPIETTTELGAHPHLPGLRGGALLAPHRPADRGEAGPTAHRDHHGARRPHRRRHPREVPPQGAAAPGPPVLPGHPHRGQRGAPGPSGGGGRLYRPLVPRRPDRDPHLPLPGGSDREDRLSYGGEPLYLPAQEPPVRLRPDALRQDFDETPPRRLGGRAAGEQPVRLLQAPGLGKAPRRHRGREEHV